MNLKQLNESYDEYILTEEYLEEGLKYLKKSKSLYKYAGKIDKRLVKLKTKEMSGKNVSETEINNAVKISSDIKKLAGEYKKIEDAYASKTLSKNVAKGKIKELKKSNEVLLNYVKSKQTKALFAKLGIAALSVALIGVLGHLAVGAGIINTSATKGFLAKAGEGLSKVFAGISAKSQAAVASLTDSQQGIAAKIQGLINKGDITKADLSGIDFNKDVANLKRAASLNTPSPKVSPVLKTLQDAGVPLKPDAQKAIDALTNPENIEKAVDPGSLNRAISSGNETIRRTITNTTTSGRGTQASHIDRMIRRASRG